MAYEVQFLAEASDFSLVQTGSGAHPDSYPIGTGESFRASWVERSDVKLTTHLHLVPKSRMVELYLHPPYVVMGV
jgi:hypothetical protein